MFLQKTSMGQAQRALVFVMLKQYCSANNPPILSQNKPRQACDYSSPDAADSHYNSRTNPSALT